MLNKALCEVGGGRTANDTTRLIPNCVQRKHIHKWLREIIRRNFHTFTDRGVIPARPQRVKT